MASFVVTTGETTARVLSAGQTGLVGATGAIMTETVSAVFVSGGGRLTVAGAISTGAADAFGASFFGAGYGNLTVSTTGVVFGMRGVNMINANSSYNVSNAGTINGSEAGVYISSATAHLLNSGSITGFNSTGVFISTSADYQIGNSGDIAGTDYGFYQAGVSGGSFTNSGHISGEARSWLLLH